MKAKLQSLAIAALTAGVLFAITAEELPDPSTGPFYVVAPTARTGAQSVSAIRTGLAASPILRKYAFPFGTALCTFAPGTLFILR